MHLKRLLMGCVGAFDQEVQVEDVPVNHAVMVNSRQHVKYEGQVLNSRPHGHGIQSGLSGGSGSGLVYEGQWVHGVQEGWDFGKLLPQDCLGIISECLQLYL
ncbi:hypothetical protein HYH03_013591 [Edaphochlamys debaryana]|uniref:Uncharacterized protein n=1 Tax=Edaphochlamys debaryana TaxID=47281 RepID=A0A835XT57_9CHLO|nr:hypothetical protein HYH03_013591 [Edaphochlamys debaryana]|eukprot:KAG2487746.1 hypothetical protein HYH03_013591 [Edaphochlamys debaryana]